jgi:hypothetical protein
VHGKGTGQANPTVHHASKETTKLWLVTKPHERTHVTNRTSSFHNSTNQGESGGGLFHDFYPANQIITPYHVRTFKCQFFPIK